MFTKQISVFVENRKGRLSEIMEVLSDGKVNLRALSMADTSDFGVLRFIADDPETVERILKSHKMTVSLNDVITVKLKDEAGSLAKVLCLLAASDIGVEYTYAFLARQSDSACVVLRSSDDVKAAALLEEAGYVTGV